MIELSDIIAGLSNVCRFGGQLETHYSVLAHSILVGDILYAVGRGGYNPNEPILLGGTSKEQTENKVMCRDPKVILWGLLHDGAEAYIGDVSSPLKKFLREQSGVNRSPYDHVEDNILWTISKKFGLPWPVPPIIKKADLIARAIEAKRFYTGTELWSGVVEIPKGLEHFGRFEESVEHLKNTFRLLVEKLLREING